MIPQNYTEWRDCIENKCGIPLTPEFVNKRIDELGDTNLQATKEFINKYSEQHYHQVMEWFKLSLPQKTFK